MTRPFAVILNWFLHTRVGGALVRLFVRLTQYRVFSPWTVRQMELDLLRLRARRLVPPAGTAPQQSRLHVGCGAKRVPGWLNVDVVGTDPLIDLAGGSLPWKDEVFEVAISQHVVEHLELESEFIPLLREIRRVLKQCGELWLSCPDMEIVCRSYSEHKGADLLADRLAHSTVPTGLEGLPPQHFINKLFHQDGEHRNLYDFDIMRWALTQAGFAETVRVSPSDFLARFPEFPPAANDQHSIYVRAGKAPGLAAT